MPDKLKPADQGGKLIPLSKGLFAIVSEEDYAYLSQFKWYASQTKNRHYAARGIDRKGIRKVIHMHRVIMRAEGQEVDHINGDTLDNRRENLRLVEHHQNLKNQRAQRRGASIYRGVYMDQETRMWVVQIKDRGRVRTVHGIEDEQIAAAVYDLLALDRFKEYARFNLPDLIAAWNRRTVRAAKEK